MKKISLIAAAVLASLSLAACGNSASQHKAKRANSSSKVVHHKHHKKQQHKKKAASSSSSSSSSVQSSSNQQQQSQQGQQTQQSSQQGVNNADAAVAAAKAKYGDQNGRVHWGYMIDGSTGQPIRNADGSYFVKGTADNGTMTGTEYSVNVHPDGSITSN